MGKFNSLYTTREEAALDLTTADKWKNALKAMSEYWKINFDEALQIYSQAPEANTITTFAKWNKAGRYINKGEKAISVITAENKIINYFDINQTNGRVLEAKWRANPDEVENILNYIKNRINSTPSENGRADFIKESAIYLCCCRCGIDYLPDFDYIEKTNDSTDIYKLGKEISKLSQGVLNEIEKEIRITRRNSHEHSKAFTRSELYREGRDTLPRFGSTQNVSKSHTDYEGIQGNGRHGGDISSTEYFGEQNIRGNSGLDNRKASDGTGKTEEFETPARGLYGADVDIDRIVVTGETDSGRISDTIAGGTQTGGEYGEVSDGTGGVSNKEERLIDNKEYEPPFSDGSVFLSKRVNTEKDNVQLSLINDGEPVELSPDERIIFAEIMYGSSFEDGKFRIAEYAKTNPSIADFSKFLAKEYGIGGRSGTGEVSSYNHDSKGIHIELRDNERFIHLNWNNVAKRISKLVNNGEYITNEDIENRIQKAKYTLKNYDPTSEMSILYTEKAKRILASYGLYEMSSADLDVEIEKQQQIVDELKEKANSGGIANRAENESILLKAEDKLAELEDELTETLYKEEKEEAEDSVTDNITLQKPEPVSETAETAPALYPVQNFSRLNSGDFYSHGAKAKYRDNIAAIKTLRKIEKENRTASPDEQQVLSRYVGWGGLSSAFDNKADLWSYEYTELKALLSEDEYAHAFKSTLTAFYTDPNIITPIFETLNRFGFNGGKILDPCMGTGNFFSMLPAEIAENSTFHGIELDSLSGQISKHLFPNAKIDIDGYEYVKIPDNNYDVIVGNVPFSDIGIYDRDYASNYLTHDYFFIKSLDKLKPGGILAFITATGTLDKVTATAREDMCKKAELIGAVRLPNNAFKEIAGTTVSTDIIFMQKRAEPVSENNNLSEWVDVEWSDLFKADVNSYFNKNPEMVLGDAKRISGRFGYTVDFLPRENQNIYTEISTAFNKLQAEFNAVSDIDNLPQQEEDNNFLDADTHEKDFTFIKRDDTLYFCENRKLIPLEEKSQKQIERIKAMDTLVTKIQNLINFQIENFNDSVISTARENLNAEYDEFVKKYGRFNDKVNNKAFSDDIRSPLLLSVEKKIEDINEYEKADIFFKNTVRINKSPEHAGTAEDALYISLNLRQRVDIGYIAALCNKSGDEVISELGRKIYLNPANYTGDNYRGWELAEEYLSGRVKDKLAQAILAAEQNPELFKRNVAALKENQPDFVPIQDIGFTIGTIFIPENLYASFMYETFNTPNYYKADSLIAGKDAIDVNYNRVLNEWSVSCKNLHRSVTVNEEFGTGRINAYSLFEQSLNQKKVEIKDKVIDENDKEKYVLNKKETMLARERQNKIEAEFKKWIYNSPERYEVIENIYNEKFNNIKPRVYDGSYIEVKGMNNMCSLRPHQKDVIARILNTGSALMAHEVGAGKTAAMAAAGMYLKGIGAINKPMYIVPKPIVRQWQTEFLTFFPTANILVTSEKDFEKKNRRRFLSKVTTGNFDAVVMTHEQFEKVPLSIERQEKMYNKKINNISEQIKALEENKGKRFSVKRMAALQERLKNKLEKLRADFKKDNYVTFEELGCDFIFVDEAHNYKNLAVFSKMNNVAGINTSANSQRATDMEMKVRYMQEINKGGGVVFATGTPIATL